MPQRRSNALCQRSVRPSSRPVPLAIESEAEELPHHRCWIHSAGETQRATLRKRAGSVLRSQSNFAGQNEARAMQPVCAWIAVSPFFLRKKLRLLATARIGPGVNRRDDLSVRVEAKQAVPETGDSDSGYGGR